MYCRLHRGSINVILCLTNFGKLRGATWEDSNSDKVRYENICLFYLPTHLGEKGQRKPCHPNASSTASMSGVCTSNAAHVSWCVNTENIPLFLWGFAGPCFTFSSKLCLNCSFETVQSMSNKLVRKCCQQQRYVNLKKKKKKEINPKCHQHSIILLRISSSLFYS